MSTVNHTNNNLPIGFFDSGVGGLSVYAKFRKELPHEDTIYFGDLKNLPYGDKTKSQLISFARNILNFYKKTGVKAVVIACNTSSAQAYETIKNEYDFPIYPIIQTCAREISSLADKRLGVFATSATVSSGVYSREIKRQKPNLEIKEIPCPIWVSIVEGHFRGNTEPVIKPHIEEMLKFKPEKIILGCTHYPYLMKELEKYAPKSIFIDPAEIFVDCINRDLRIKGLINPKNTAGTEEFFVSANPLDFVKNARIFYDVKTTPKVV